MSERSFTHLHTHTEFSMLDGAARVGDLVAAAAADRQPALGITDHGNMYGVLDFYKACRDQGIVPIIGTEAYMAGESRHERPVRRGRVDDTGGDVEGGQKLYYHLTLLAETVEGYRNLMKLSSAAYLEGYYYKPRLDWELLERHHDGLIATTGCLGGVVLQALLSGDPAEAERRAARLQDIFGRDNLFVELQDHGLADQHSTNPQLMEIARRLNAPLLATNDSHYTHREDAVAHDALLCVQTGALLADTNRFKFEGTEHYLKSANEMRHLFRDVPEACDNTLLIAERADVQIELGKPSLPEFPVPDRFTGATYEDRALAYLRDLTMEGARQRYGDPVPAEVMERLDFELSVIGDMGFPAYFLVVWDLIRFAARTASGWARAGDRRPAAVWRIAFGSSTSTRSVTTFSSSASSTRAESRCPTSTWTSTSATGPTSCATPPRSTAATGWRRSSRSRRSRRGPPCATPLGCWGSPTSSATRSPRPCHRSSWAGTRRSRRASPRRRATRTVSPAPASCARCTRRIPRPRRSSTWRWASKACAARTASMLPPWSSPGTR